MSRYFRFWEVLDIFRWKFDRIRFGLIIEDQSSTCVIFANPRVAFFREITFTPILFVHPTVASGAITVKTILTSNARGSNFGFNVDANVVLAFLIRVFAIG